MRREYKVVGKIDEHTPVLGTAYGQVREAMRGGFEKQFSLIGRGHDVDKSEAEATVARCDSQYAECQAALFTEQASEEGPEQCRKNTV